MTAGDLARIKIFAVPIPETPTSSTTHPDLPDDWLPKALTQSGAVSGIQVLPNGRLLFTRSSLTGPNDVFVLRNLDLLDLSSEKSRAGFKPEIQQLTRLTESALEGKSLVSGEDFWFEGAKGKQIHGWILKPPGFKEGEKKQWPIVLLIHGGTRLFSLNVRLLILRMAT